MDGIGDVITIENAGLLDDKEGILPHSQAGIDDHYSCNYCGVGDSGLIVAGSTKSTPSTANDALKGVGVLEIKLQEKHIKLKASLDASGKLKVLTNVPLASTGGVLSGEFRIGEKHRNLTAKEIDSELSSSGVLRAQTFLTYQAAGTVSDTRIEKSTPTKGCMKFKLSLMQHNSLFPIHTIPSVIDQAQKKRRAVTYEEAISRLADLLLGHRNTNGKTLIYACGQVDYFTIFAMQDVFRLLGIRNLTGNSEHGSNAGAVHNEILTGQEGPFLTIKQAVTGPNRFYILNGWNGYITHPPVFDEISTRDDLDAYLIEVMETETAKVLEKKINAERVLLIRPRTDPHLAAAVANEIFNHHKQAIDERFIEHFSDEGSYKKFMEMGCAHYFKPEVVAKRIAPTAKYVDRLTNGIKDIARKLCQPDVVPINIPSVGLSQTSGVVAHCLWGNVLAMLGKYGLKAKDQPAGGTLRLTGQVNAESEVQGLSRHYFMGRIPMDDAAEAAKRMDLPEDAYTNVLKDTPRAALDYSDPTPEKKELFIFFGTQFEANMMGRTRWLRKLKDADTSLVVIDPIPDPFSIEHADLIIPSPPHPATTKLYQNGEWKLSLSMPQKQAAKETRTDTTIIYDVMAEIANRISVDTEIAKAHPDLARHAKSGYLGERYAASAESRPGREVLDATQVSTKKLRTELTIGRSDYNDIVIDEKRISRRHALLICTDRDEPRFRIKDLDSFNGVYKNEKQVRDVDFGIKDDITLGRVSLLPDQYLPLFGLLEKWTAQLDHVPISKPKIDGGLKRISGEVCRLQLWDRIMSYMSGGSGPLYCRPEHEDGRPISWQDLLEKGSIIYGGVGVTRYLLDYDKPEKLPFANIYRQPKRFQFFNPSRRDFDYPSGVILNSGRSSLSDDREHIRYATSSFNSGKASPIVNMPTVNPLHISHELANKYKLKMGDHVRITGRHTEGAIVLPINITSRVKGDSVYVSFHKSKAQIERNHYINTVTSRSWRCPYSSQTRVKASQVLLEKIGESKASNSSVDATSLKLKTAERLHVEGDEIKSDIEGLNYEKDLPVWSGQTISLSVTDIIQESQDVYTFRFQGNPLCRFIYLPGQFCTLALNIEGKIVLRSYAISSTPSRPYVLEITIKQVPGGFVSNWFPSNLKVGDHVTITGPKGKFGLSPSQIPEKILLISGGIGITPMMAMSRWLCDISANSDIKLLNSVHSPNDIIFGNELGMLSSRYKLFEPLHVVTSKQGSIGSGWTGLSGRVNQKMLEVLVPDLDERHVYLCGPPGYMDMIKTLLKGMGFDMTRLQTESFIGVRTAAHNKPIPEPMKNISLMPTRVEDPVSTNAGESTTSFAIEFSRSGQTSTIKEGVALLDHAEAHDIDVDYGCRSGYCGKCKVKVIDGQVSMQFEEGLKPEEKAAGYVLSCVGVPRSNCVIDA